MQFEEAKIQFIQAWGTLGSKWGINRTMAQVHALLLISPEALSADSIMQELSISRGNANMNLRALIDWGLIKKELKPGERKEFFFAEKDISKVSKQIIRQRKKRELEPIRAIMKDLQHVEGSGPEHESFKKAVEDLTEFTDVADKVLERLAESDKNWVLNSFLKLLK